MNLRIRRLPMTHLCFGAIVLCKVMGQKHRFLVSIFRDTVFVTCVKSCGYYRGDPDIPLHGYISPGHILRRVPREPGPKIVCFLTQSVQLTLSCAVDFAGVCYVKYQNAMEISDGDDKNRYSSK